MSKYSIILKTDKLSNVAALTHPALKTPNTLYLTLFLQPFSTTLKSADYKVTQIKELSKYLAWSGTH